MADFDNIFIDRNEVLRYLGHSRQKINPEMDELINVCINEVHKNSKFLYTYRIFRPVFGNNGIIPEGTSILLPGNNIAKHLKGSEKIAIMAVSLGTAIDKLISMYSRTEISKAVIFDACATAAVESLCDKVQDEIKHIAEKEHLYIRSRYSPGYGDLPVSIQPDILNILDSHRKIGLSATDSFLLTPAKSVTAITGFFRYHVPSTLTADSHCEGCALAKECKFKKEGKYCDR